MIKFKHISYKNFLSIGNKPMEYDFIEDQFYLIKGKNGSGKSLLIDALCFVLYGKAYRKIKLEKLVNWINEKECRVEIEFEVGSNEYKVVRGIKPNIFEVYINGKKQKEDADRRTQQKLFEQNILKMDLNTFKQLVVLGSKSYKPFMRMGKPEKNIIIEDLLNIGVYNIMYQVTKGKLSTTEKNIDFLREKAKKSQNAIKLAKEYKERSDKSSTLQEYQKKKTNLVQELSSKEENRLEHQNKLDDLNKQLLKERHNKLSKDLDKLQKAKHEIDTATKDADKQISFFNDNDECPTCSQDINPNHKQVIVQKHEESLDKNQKLLDKWMEVFHKKDDEKVQIEKTLDQIESLESDIKFLDYEIEGLQKRIKETDESIQKEQQRNEENTEYLKDQITKEQQNLKDLKIQVEDEYENKHSFEKITELLNNDGIKKQIIKTYIPLINKLIRKYLDIMEFNVDFQFDEDFNETIKARGREDTTYGSFSEGEKLRIDLCLLFTWREISRMKNNSATNLIIFDEIGDSSLDETGFDCFMKILKSDKARQCAIIISHQTENIENKVDRVYSYIKRNEFTELESLNTQPQELSIL